MNSCRRILWALLATIALLVFVAWSNVHTKARIRERFADPRPPLAAGLPSGDLVAPSEAEFRALSAQVLQTDHFVLGTGLVGVALALLLALLLRQSILRPIRVLHQTALDIADGRFDRRVGPSSCDELGRLGSSLNALAERLAVAMECIATLRASQESLQQSLAEKDLLLREVHHRIKNNLQIVSSLLDLQSRSIGRRSLVEEFEASQNRIRCMGLVHEQLYGAGRYDRIGTREYLNCLATHLVECFGRGRNVRLQLELENLHLDVDRAMTLGLLANELLCNAFKHAFPEHRSGEVRMILASRGDACVLVVADDGVGMRREAQPDPAGRGLGMSLVGTLAKQLRGSMAIDNRSGTCVSITFPMVGGSRGVAAA